MILNKNPQKPTMFKGIEKPTAFIYTYCVYIYSQLLVPINLTGLPFHFLSAKNHSKFF